MAGRRSNGEGSVTQRKDGRWEAKVSLPNGRRISRYGASKQEAREKLKEAQKQIDNGLDLSAPSVTMRDFLNTWLTTAAKPSIKTSTYETYESVVRVRLIPYIGDVKLLKLTPVRIQTLYATFSEGDKKISNQSILHVHRVLSQALEQAVRWNLLPRNPCAGVTPPRPVANEMAVWTAEEANALLAATAEDPMHALFVLALSTGMRQGELLGLKWSDIDFEAGKLHIRRSVTRHKGEGLVFTQPKTSRSRRPIKLGRRAIDALKARRRIQVEQRLKVGPLWQEVDLVFSTAYGGPLESGWIYRIFRRTSENAGVSRIRFHDMRHTAATLLLSQNVHVKVVSEMLGHSNVSITLNTYSHFVPSLHDQAADVMDSLLTA